MPARTAARAAAGANDHDPPRRLELIALLHGGSAYGRSPLVQYFATCNSTWGALMHRLNAYAEGKEPTSLHGQGVRAERRVGRATTAVSARALTRTEVIQPTAHLVNPPHRLAVGGEQQDGAVVDDDLHVALVVLDA